MRKFVSNLFLRDHRSQEIWIMSTTTVTLIYAFLEQFQRALWSWRISSIILHCNLTVSVNNKFTFIYFWPTLSSEVAFEEYPIPLRKSAESILENPITVIPRSHHLPNTVLFVHFDHLSFQQYTSVKVLLFRKLSLISLYLPLCLRLPMDVAIVWRQGLRHRGRVRGSQPSGNIGNWEDKQASRQEFWFLSEVWFENKILKAIRF